MLSKNIDQIIQNKDMQKQLLDLPYDSFYKLIERDDIAIHNEDDIFELVIEYIQIRENMKTFQELVKGEINTGDSAQPPAPAPTESAPPLPAEEAAPPPPAEEAAPPPPAEEAAPPPPAEEAAPPPPAEKVAPPPPTEAASISEPGNLIGGLFAKRFGAEPGDALILKGIRDMNIISNILMRKHKLNDEQKKGLLLLVRYKFVSHEKIMKESKNPLLEAFRSILMEGLSCKLKNFEPVSEIYHIIQNPRSGAINRHDEDHGKEAINIPAFANNFAAKGSRNSRHQGHGDGQGQVDSTNPLNMMANSMKGNFNKHSSDLQKADVSNKLGLINSHLKGNNQIESNKGMGNKGGVNPFSSFIGGKQNNNQNPNVFNNQNLTTSSTDFMKYQQQENQVRASPPKFNNQYMSQNHNNMGNQNYNNQMSNDNIFDQYMAQHQGSQNGGMKGNNMMHQSMPFSQGVNKAFNRNNNAHHSNVNPNNMYSSDMEERDELVFSYQYDFDENGALYFLGTLGHTNEYVNPYNRSLIKVFFSSMGRGSYEDFVGRTLVNCRTLNEPNAFMGIDFGIERFMIPSCYTFRNRDSSRHVMLNWVFEASTDFKTWFILDKRIHKTDDPAYNKMMERERHMIEKRGATSTWSIDQNSLKMASRSITMTSKTFNGFRYFRIKQISKNSSGADNLALSGFEIYGVGVGMNWSLN